jgi:hypothetical protein
MAMANDIGVDLSEWGASDNGDEDRFSPGAKPDDLRC